MKVIVLTFPCQNLPQAVKDCRRQGLTVFLECTSLAEAQAGEQAGADGIIAKGHEAGGRVGNETTFILLQRLLKNIRLPVYAQGGIGLHTAAACYAAGAAGVVLDAQLALTRESPFPEPIKAQIATLDGSETVCLGEELGFSYRLLTRFGQAGVKSLKELEASLCQEGLPPSELDTRWRDALSRLLAAESLDEQVFLFGQDIALAAPLARRFADRGRHRGGYPPGIG